MNIVIYGNENEQNLIIQIIKNHLFNADIKVINRGDHTTLKIPFMEDKTEIEVTPAIPVDLFVKSLEEVAKESVR